MGVKGSWGGRRRREEDRGSMGADVEAHAHVPVLVDGIVGRPPIVATLLADAVRRLLISATAARVRRTQRAVLFFVVSRRERG